MKIGYILILLITILLSQISCRKNSIISYKFKATIYNDSTKKPFDKVVKLKLIENVKGNNKISLLNTYPDETDGPIQINTNGTFLLKVKTMGKHSNYTLKFYYENDISPFNTINNLNINDIYNFNETIIYIKPH